MTDHLWLDFDLVEFLSAVDTNNTSDHFWDDDHVTQVSLDKVWLLVWLCFLLCFAEFLDETHRATLQATVESTTSASVDDIAELF